MPRINVVPMYDETAARTPPMPDTIQRRMALAKSLMSDETGPIYSPAAGIAKVAEKAFGGWMAGQAERDYQDALKASGEAQAQFFGMGGGSSTSWSPSASGAAPASGDTVGPMGSDGVSGDYLATLRLKESNNDPNAKAKTSSAQGLYQFTDGTWADVMKNAPELGLTPDGRSDPEQQERAVQWFTQRNGAELAKAGHEATPQNLYMAHFLGASGANRFLNGLRANPNAPAESYVDPEAARANATIFYDRNTGEPLPAQAVYERLTKGFAPSQQAQANPADLPATGAVNTGIVVPPPPSGSPAAGPQSMALARALATPESALPSNLMDDLSPTAVMQLEGPNRENEMARILQGNPQTARPDGVDRTLLARALLNYQGSAGQSDAPAAAPASAALTHALNPALQGASASSGVTPRETSLQIASQSGEQNDETNPAPGGGNSASGAPVALSGPVATGTVGATPANDDARMRAMGMRILQDPYASPQVKALVAHRLGPTQYSYQTLSDGTVLRIDPRGGAPVPVYRAEGKPELKELNGRLIEYRGGTARDITPQGVPQGYRTLTSPEERAQYGISLDDKRPYQIGPDGKLSAPPGGTTVNLPAAEKAEDAERGKGLAKRLNDIADDGADAETDLMVAQRLDTLMRGVEPGAMTAILEEIRRRTGIAIDPSAGNVQAAGALVEYLVPRMRVPGSGTSSDRDMSAFRGSLASLRGTPEGNAIVMQTIGGMAQYRADRSRIATEWQLGNITAKEATARMKALPDPFQAFKEWQSRQGQQTSKGTSSSAPQGSNGSPARPQTQADFDSLPKGALYIDPDDGKTYRK